MGHDNTAHDLLRTIDAAATDDLSGDKARELTQMLAALTAIPLDVLPAGERRDALFALAEDVSAIPTHMLPSLDAIGALFALAAAGHDVDVYQPMNGDTWIFWVRPQYPYMEGRYTTEEWEAAYADEVARILGSKEVA